TSDIAIRSLNGGGDSRVSWADARATAALDCLRRFGRPFRHLGGHVVVLSVQVGPEQLCPHRRRKRDQGGEQRVLDQVLSFVVPNETGVVLHVPFSWFCLCRFRGPSGHLGRHVVVPSVQIRPERLRTHCRRKGDQRGEQGVLDQVLRLVFTHEPSDESL